MMKGQLAPESVRFYLEPVMVNLNYSKLTKDPFPTPQEAQVWFDLDGELKTAFVPLGIVDEERGTVTVALVRGVRRENPSIVSSNQLRADEVLSKRGCPRKNSRRRYPK